MNPKIKQILKKEGIVHYKKDIRQMSRRELRKNFSFKTSGRLNATLLLKNIIWQAYQKIQAGQAEPVEGNIRSFWYQNVKPVLSRLGLKTSGERYTSKLYDVFVELTVEHHLFRYTDFGFIDERAHARTIGKTNGNLIIFVEKDGLLGLARQVAEAHDTTAVSHAGFPSYLSTEFLVRQMAGQGLLCQPVRLFSVVDYDPSGYWIEREFVKQLQEYQVEVAGVCSLITPKGLPAELVEACKYRLKKDSRTANWVETTGGIDGKAYGLEADAWGGKRIRQGLAEAIQPYLAGQVAMAGQVSYGQASREAYWAWLVE